MKCNFKSQKLVIFYLVLFMVFHTTNLVDSTISLPTTYFPIDDWRRATLDEFGINSTRIGMMNNTIVTQDIGVDSIHIIRHGYLVYERYFEYYNHSNLHHLMSVTKSVTSILVGIAQAEGFISDLDEPVLEIFTDRNFSNVDSRKEALTIRHLLQMRSGLEWNSQDVPFLIGTIDKHDYDLVTNISNWWDLFPSNPVIDWNLMIHSPDWIQFVLDKPMVADPGTEFYYNSGCSHLLSAIIAKKTGMNTERFAKQYLFDPLNINNYTWQNDSQSLSMGGFGLWLQPNDMAKIGYLCLNNGQWNGEEIIPPDWIFDSTQDYSPGSGYGYQWWTFYDSDHESSYYKAIGFGGQYIIVIPDASVVVVLTSSEFHNSNPNALFVSYILHSIDFDFTYTEPTTSTPVSSTSTTSEVSTDEPSSITDTSLPSTSPQTTSFISITAIIGFVLLIVVKKKE